MSYQIIVQFENTLYEDSVNGKEAVCRAVTRCVLPRAVDSFEWLAVVGATPEPTAASEHAKNATRAPTIARATCSSDVVMSEYMPYAVPGSPGDLAAIVVTARETLSSGSIFTRSTCDCLTETLRYERFWIASDALSARVSFVKPMPRDSDSVFALAFVAVLILASLAVKLYSGESTNAPATTSSSPPAAKTTRFVPTPLPPPRALRPDSRGALTLTPFASRAHSAPSTAEGESEDLIVRL